MRVSSGVTRASDGEVMLYPPQHTTPGAWSAYAEGPWGKKNRETVTSNWAPAQCLDNSKHYVSMAQVRSTLPIVCSRDTLRLS